MLEKPKHLPYKLPLSLVQPTVWWATKKYFSVNRLIGLIGTARLST